jgi:hypothetical protein
VRLIREQAASLVARIRKIEPVGLLDAKFPDQ